MTTQTPAGVATHRCAIEVCPMEIRRTQLMCIGHWRLVPKPIQQEIYGCFRKRRGGPTHRAAIQRAIASVQEKLDGWTRRHAGDADSAAPGWLPYRDD